MSMFDAATAFSYHNSPSSPQNAKGLFSNLALPSTQLLSSSLVMLPLSGYFSQRSMSSQEPEKASQQQNISSPNMPSHSTPQQPTHNNKRSSRRAVQQQQQQLKQSFSSAIASTLAVGNMSNILSSSNSSDSNSTNDNSVALKKPSPVNNGAHSHHRRKRASNKIIRKKIDQAIAFSAYAVEEDHQENSDCALDLYLMALEQMLEALPVHVDQSRRDALKNKLKEFMDRTELTEEFIESTKSPSSSPDFDQDAKKCECTSSTWSPSHSIKDYGISQHIINAAITSAVALKQSPIPDAVSATVNYTMRKIKNIDETYGLQDKAWEISRTGINLALEIDQQYNVHEKVGNALFTGITAAVKASFAYKDSPSYRELRMKDDTCNETQECTTC